MLDPVARAVVGPAMRWAGKRLAAVGVTANALTLFGLAVGIAAAVAAGRGVWMMALVLWLINRGLDGLDGAVARLAEPTDQGAFLDIAADFTVYGAFVVGVAVAVPDARLACAFLLAAYYVNGSVFLAFSSLAERRGLDTGDERSLRFIGGLTEGTETVIAHGLFCLLPAAAAVIAWVFAGMVAATALWRVALGWRLLRA
jgi:phosphatidylglycerophosphate synthase